MDALVERALAYARVQPVDLSGLLCGVQGWHLIDATTDTVHDALCGGAWDQVLHGDSRCIKCSRSAAEHRCAITHDSRHLQIDESWQGYGLLADLAFIRPEHFRACDTHGIRFVIRLKGTGSPKVKYIARGQVTQKLCPGTDHDALLEQEVLCPDGRVIDAYVNIRQGTYALLLHLVGVQPPKGYCFFLTNWLHRIGPRQVVDLSGYDRRWNSASGWICQSSPGCD
jgi:hypothetical protein